MLTLRFDHQEYGDTVRIPVDSDWAGSEERYSTLAGLEFHGGHLVDVSGKVSSEVTKVPLAESRRLCVTESKSLEYIERKDGKETLKCEER